MIQYYSLQMETVQVTIGRSTVVIDCDSVTEESRPLVYVITWVSPEEHHHIE